MMPAWTSPAGVLLLLMAVLATGMGAVLLWLLGPDGRRILIRSLAGGAVLAAAWAAVIGAGALIVWALR